MMSLWELLLLIVLSTATGFSRSHKKRQIIGIRSVSEGQGGSESDSVWSSAADRLVSGVAGEKFVKEDLAKLEAEASALKAKKDAEKLRGRETMSRATSARQAISSLSSNVVDNIPTDPPLQQESNAATRRKEPEETKTNKVPERESINIPLPFMEASTIGIAGKWKEKYGNFVIRPDAESSYNKGNEDGVLNQPLGVIHFLGGAFVGAAPHLTYRYLLEGLADAGYIVVATPYRLDFDYVEICDTILSKFDRVAVELAQEFGAVPVVGLGHSCGALLQTLVTSLFPDAPRAANVLVSFNNRPARDAIPGFDEVVVPFSNAVAGDNDQARNLWSVAANVRQRFDSAVNAYARSPLSPKFVGTELVPLLNQGLEVLDQVPGILESIAQGSEEFTPTPADTKEACRRMYRARSTLLIKFDDDNLDESSEVESTLKEANTIMRMKRPMVEMDVKLSVIEGTHLTPLSQTFIPGPPEGFDDALEPLRDQIKAVTPALRQASEVRSTILGFLGDCIGRGQIGLRM